MFPHSIKSVIPMHFSCLLGHEITLDHLELVPAVGVTEEKPLVIGGEHATQHLQVVHELRHLRVLQEHPDARTLQAEPLLFERDNVVHQTVPLE